MCSTTTRETEASGKSPGRWDLLGAAAYNGFQCVFADFDNDSHPDIYVAGRYHSELALSQPRRRDIRRHFAVERCQPQCGRGDAGGMGVAVGDFDNDGDLDLFETHFSEDYNTLYRNEGGRFFLDVSYAADLGEESLPFVGWGTGFFDFDNDGDLDLFVANGHVYPVVDNYDLGTSYAQYNLLFENLGNGKFAEVSALSGSGLP